MITQDNLFYKTFIKALDQMHEYYDSNEKMIKRLYYTAGYHTKLSGGYVHPVKDSLEYAVALLDSGIAQHKDRAVEIINKIISLQDQNPDSKTYGIWSYYLEEPLDKMSPPDYNWADFNGKDLICLLMEHKEQLTHELITKIESAINHAAYSIIRRNVGPDYTNISLMGAYVTLKSGEILKDQCLIEYGKIRLKKALAYTQSNGSFTEYNSPTYTIVALEVIGSMLKYFSDKSEIIIAEELNNYGWKILAKHYHPTTGQLSAPHARCYDNMVDDHFLSFIHVGTRCKLDLLNEEDIVLSRYKNKDHYVANFEWSRIMIKCPEKYYDSFLDLKKTQFYKEIYYKGNYNIAEDEEHVLIRSTLIPELEARTLMTPNYSLGSFTKSDLWNQRRALMAYWGSKQNPSYIRLKCLKDDYDYSSAILFASQNNNHVIGGINFVTDYGDTHIILDPVKNASVKINKLNIRFELGGQIDDVIIPEKFEINKSCVIETSTVIIVIKYLYAKFADYPVKFERGGDSQKVWLDVVLYEGEEKSIDLSELDEAVVLFCMSIYDKGIEKNIVEQTFSKDNEGHITCKMLDIDQLGEIKIASKPCTYVKNMNIGKII